MTDTGGTGTHHDVRGSGPVLLVLPGGAGHPMGLDALTARLARRFTVVTHDPLGLAHGRLGLPVADQRPGDWSGSALRVLDEVSPGGEPAYVFGTSAGGVAALDLWARHPERLRHVVAHEPPCVAALPDGAALRDRFREVRAVHRTAGPAAAASLLTAVLEEREERAPGPAPEPGAAPAAPRPLTREEELASPMALFLAHVLVPFTAHGLPVPAPGAGATLTLAAGETSRGLLLHRTATALADRLGADLAEFPGGHLGALEHPEDFADRLTAVLDRAPARPETGRA
ncbi:alpha/beta fold hydrolase [Streptomyces andamanensis]|uniref:Alpha/beta fold hydrolase n=1 Tax=Streptomyces andamanensis TaxID=1565035 RepID=A0ABV8TFD6_9ACTN